MKTPLLFLLLLGLVFSPLLAADAPNAELTGEIRRVIPQGIVVKGNVEAPGETWEGNFVLIGYPKEKAVATGDTLPRMVGKRVESIEFSKATLRAYQFVRAGGL